MPDQADQPQQHEEEEEAAESDEVCPSPLPSKLEDSQVQIKAYGRDEIDHGCILVRHETMGSGSPSVRGSLSMIRCLMMLVRVHVHGLVIYNYIDVSGKNVVCYQDPMIWAVVSFLSGEG